MFIPSHYLEDDIEVQKQVINNVTLGTIITMTEQGEFNANPIPFVLKETPEGKLYLLGHFHVKNNIGKELAAQSQEALVVFQGPNDYITPDWYPTKHETHKVAPTWLYATVHVYGKPRIVKDSKELQGILEALTDKLEAGKEKPWKVTDTPESYLNILKKSINGLEIEVTRIEGKFKMNQVQPAQDIKGTVDGFKARDGDKKSEIMAGLVESSVERYQERKAEAKRNVQA